MPREWNPDAPRKAVELSDFDRGSLDDLLHLARRGYLGSNEVAQSVYAYHEDSVDGTHSAALKFWMPRGMTKIADMGLRFALLPFRSYSKAAAAGGQATVTSGASSAADTAAVAAGTSGTEGAGATAPGGGVDAPTGITISRSSTGKLLYDPFDGAVGDNWTVVAGTVAIEAGELSVAASGGAVGAGVKSKATYSNSLVYGGQVTVAAGYAFVYWHLSGSNYYRFYIPSGASVTATLVRFDAGAPTTLDSEAGVACVIGTTYAWKILHNTVTGAIKVYWGGNLILSATDNTYTTGLVYLYSSAATINTAHVHYDNVGISSANSITVSGLPTGWDVTCGGVTATESGGTATLDMAGVALPQTTLQVRDASDAVKVTYTSTNDVWGGDVLAVSDASNTITVTGLPDGWDATCGGVTAHEVNGTATLDMEGVALPVESITIRDASDTEMTTLTPEDGVWGGNVFAASWAHTHTGPSHEHSVPSHVHLMPHTHTVDIADHEHAAVYGIYEATTATGVTVTINGTDRTAALGGGAGFTADQDWLDINRTGWLTFGVAYADCLNTIVLTSTQLGRIRAQVDGLVMRGLAQ